MFHRPAFVAIASVSVLVATAFAVAPTVFVPDATFKGSAITGWHTLGQADWSARDGEIIGKPRGSGSGGWLVLDKSLQDVGVFASFRCTEGCRTGILLRA